MTDIPECRLLASVRAKVLGIDKKKREIYQRTLSLDGIKKKDTKMRVISLECTERLLAEDMANVKIDLTALLQAFSQRPNFRRLSLEKKKCALWMLVHHYPFPEDVEKNKTSEVVLKY